ESYDTSRMKKPIALVAAMEEELEALLARFPQHDARVHFNTRLFHARHGDQELVIAQTGVGKVNAACTLALLLSDFGPGCVINTGTAGGLKAGQRILDLLVPEEIVYTDVDVTPLGLAFGQMLGSEPRFRASPALLARFREVLATRPEPPACHHGLLGSSDSFIHSQQQLAQIRARFQDSVACVDMEGGAIAHTCTRFGVPFLILRALSDVPGDGNNALDFKTFLKSAAAGSADLCRALVERLSACPDADGHALSRGP
ncbi:MAG TPA: 5'-methylthioadenosine/adenosylhomocysteine nucleosidase, partial [Kiritimatiellia bacterium]|nr:5'-methylthioadenosine/adenosylhomocysteine nucleosidase [Kiritimatiellia bacterium]